ncbi:MAG: hypothetical protein AAGE94_10505 [Acidobacteriota bacterium]
MKTTLGFLAGLGLVSWLVPTDVAAGDPSSISLRVEERATVTSAIDHGRAPATKAIDVDLILDTDEYQLDFGFTDSDGNAVQGLYANRFTPDTFPLFLDEVRILFGCPGFLGSGCEGVLFDIVIFEDPDADSSPQTGARTIAVREGLVASNDGSTFTSVPLDPPVRVDGPGDLYVGFVPRWIVSGTERVLPAAGDGATGSPGRSWALRWDEDPPDPPTFPAALANTIGTFGARGSFKIRAFGFLPDGTCVPSETTLCLGEGNRFEVRVGYDTALGGGTSGDGQATSLAPLGVDDGGVFWFFDSKNPELLVKVLDACTQPAPRFWVFFAATTNVGFTLTIEDTLTGTERTYVNPDLQRADAVTDTDAFATCEAP